MPELDSFYLPQTIQILLNPDARNNTDPSIADNMINEDDGGGGGNCFISQAYSASGMALWAICGLLALCLICCRRLCKQ